MSIWSKEEDQILIDNFDRSKGQISEILRSHGYVRTEDGVRRRRQRLRYMGVISDSYISSTMATDTPDHGGIPNAPIVASPEGFDVRRVSTNYDGDGNIRQQWVSVDKDREETIDQLKEAVAALLEPCEGLSLSIPAPVDTTDDLMVVYPIADLHFGMHADKAETGADYNMDIAEKDLLAAMTELVQSAPPTKTCLIANLGDLFHTDTVLNKTMQSGHILDVDGRWPNIVQRGTKVYRDLINLALQKHERVVVKSSLGNHDLHSSLWLAMLMAAYFQNNDRVEIELPISHFSYYKYGKNLIGITHGTVKGDRLPLIMATDKSVEWGDSVYRVWFTGHTHHTASKEHPGCTVETLPALASKDSWTSSSGYRSNRSMQAIVLTFTGGEHGRRTVNL